MNADLASHEDALLRLLADRFANFFEVKRWLEQNSIAFSEECDSWA